jgi:very-short-patch-repair endonuclease
MSPFQFSCGYKNPSPLMGEGQGEGKSNMTDRLISLAKDLRKRLTATEQHLWKHLRGKQFEGLKFKRQQPVGKYIVDFMCFEKKIIIELDGGQHMQLLEKQKDGERDAWFEAQGYTILRFWDNEVLMNTRGVLEVISTYCQEHPPLNPLPSREGK